MKANTLVFAYIHQHPVDERKANQFYVQGDNCAKFLEIPSKQSSYIVFTIVSHLLSVMWFVLNSNTSDVNNQHNSVVSKLLKS